MVEVLRAEIARLVSDRDQLLTQLRGWHEAVEGRVSAAVRAVQAEEARLRQRLVDTEVARRVAEAEAELLRKVGHRQRCKGLRPAPT